MAVFRIALVNELEKLYKRKKAFVAVLLSLAMIIIGQLSVLGVRTGFGIRGAGNDAFPLLVLSVAVNSILPLFTALVTVDSFSGEFAQNTMKITLTRPVSRLKLFAAKISAISLFLLTILCLLLIFSLITGFLFRVNTPSVSDILHTFLAYGVSILPLVILALGIVLIAMLFKSGVSVFFLTVIGFLGCKVLGLVFFPYANLLLTTHLDWYTLWLSQSLPWDKIIRQFLLMTGYALMFFTAGFYFFDKKEV